MTSLCERQISSVTKHVQYQTDLLGSITEIFFFLQFYSEACNFVTKCKCQNNDCFQKIFLQSAIGQTNRWSRPKIWLNHCSVGLVMMLKPTD